MTTDQLLKLPPAKISEVPDSLTVGEHERIVEDLDALLQCAIWKRAYMNHRLMQNNEHAAAVKAANKALVKLRSLLGYSVPAAATINV